MKAQRKRTAVPRTPDTKSKPSATLIKRFSIVKPYGLLIMLFLVLALVPIWATRFLPLQDYGDWVHQSYVMKHYTQLSSDYTLRFLPAPNLGFGVMTLLQIIVPSAEIAGKLLLSLYVIGFPLAVLYLFRSLSGKRSSFELAGFLISQGTAFYWGGQISFMVGLAVALFAIGYGFRLATKVSGMDVWRTIMLMILLTIVYFSHALALAIAVVPLLLISLFQAGTPKFRTSALHLGIALLPSLALASIYVLGGAGFGGKGMVISPVDGAMLTVLTNLPYELFTPVMQSGLLETLVFLGNILTIITMAALIALNISSIRKAFSSKARASIVVAAFFLFIMSFASPLSMAGIYGIGMRFLAPALLLFLISLESALWPRFTLVTLSALIIVHSTFTGVQSWQVGNRLIELDQAYAVKVEDVPTTIFLTLNNRTFDSPLGRLSWSSNPAYAMPHYLAVKRNQFTPVFETGVLKNSNPVYLSYPPELIDPAHKGANNSVSLPAAVSLLQSGRLGSFNMVVVTGSDRDIDSLLQATRDYPVVARGEYFAVLERSTNP